MSEKVIPFSLPAATEEHEVAVTETQVREVISDLLRVPLSDVRTREHRGRYSVEYPNPVIQLHGSTLTVTQDSWWKCLRVIYAASIAEGSIPNPLPPTAA